MKAGKKYPEGVRVQATAASVVAPSGGDPDLRIRGTTVVSLNDEVIEEIEHSRDEGGRQ